eukprot:5890635-Pyramimonas_sp.AAC.1
MDRHFPLSAPEDRLCRRCQQEEDTLAHRIWRCPCNKLHADFTSTDGLIPRALAPLESETSLWLRGVPPAHVTHPVSQEASESLGRAQL